MVKIWRVNFIHTNRSVKEFIPPRLGLEGYFSYKKTHEYGTDWHYYANTSRTPWLLASTTITYNTVIIKVSNSHSIWFPFHPTQLPRHRGSSSDRNMTVLLRSVQTGSGAQKNLLFNGKWARLNRLGHEGELLEDNTWIYTSIPPHVFIVCTETTVAFSTNATHSYFTHLRPELRKFRNWQRNKIKYFSPFSRSLIIMLFNERDKTLV